MRRFEKPLRWIDSQAEELRDRVASWAGINSGSHHLAGLERMAAVLAEACRPPGGELRLIDLPEMEMVDDRGRVGRQAPGRAIHVVKRPGAAKRVLLGIHYDTVYGVEHPFQGVAQIDARTLRGPGVADAKGGIAVMLAAVEALERSEFSEGLGWEIVLNPDEEIGSPGSAALFGEAARRCQVGLLFEPCWPDGALVGARKGSGNFVVVVMGKSAHAGRDPQAGRNAIHALAEFIVGLKAIGGDGVTINVGRVEGGGPVNIVPDLAVGRFNVRVESVEQQRSVEQRLRRIGEEIGRDGIGVRVHGGFSAPPKPMDGATLGLLEQIAGCGREMGLDLRWRSSGGVCDGNRLAAAGLPTVDTLGPRGGNLHSAEEYLVVESLVERAKLAALVLMKLAAGEIKVKDGTP
jgi:glutamate carboxypeptidase